MKDEQAVSYMVAITPKIQPYAWGDDSFIPALLGKKSDGKPKAELWFGTHPGGESTLADSTPLGDFIRDHADDFLGRQQVNRQGKDVPFLLKVLAIAKPLSLQVHPTTEQAQKGYAEEVASHVDLPREQWNYKDDRQKAEVLYALTPVTAMCGFLSSAKIAENLRSMVPYQFPLLFPFLQENQKSDESTLVERFFTTLYTLETDQLKSLLEEFREQIGKLIKEENNDGMWLSPVQIAHDCLTLYPNDPGVLAPFFLNVVQMKPGETIFLEPRTLHAYVKGNAIELMTNSDNVVRGGLTHKKVNVPLLLKTLTFKPHTADLCPQIPDATDKTNVFAPTDDFLLSVFKRGVYEVNQRKSIEFLLCTEGNAVMTSLHQTVSLGKGECIVVAASLPDYHLEVDGTVFSASVPG
jgi:mannose-6-phosphate isomerase